MEVYYIQVCEFCEKEEKVELNSFRMCEDCEREGNELSDFDLYPECDICGEHKPTADGNVCHECYRG